MGLEITNVFLTKEFHDAGKAANVNTDVVVELRSGEKYIASFFTFQSVALIRQEHLKSGAFLAGKYFWDKNMILIDECSEELITPVIRHLIEEGNFKSVFSKL